MLDRKELYNRKCEELQILIASNKKRASLFLAGKLLSFALVVTIIALYYENITLLNTIITLSIVAIYIMLIIADEKLKGSTEKLKRIYKLCQDEVSYFDGDFSNFDSGERYKDTYHKYSYDLDIFGVSSLYNRINRTVTDKGSDILARKLETIPTDSNIVEENQDAIKELSDMIDWRIDFTSNKYTYNNLALLSNISNNSDKVRNNPIFSKYIYISLALTAIVMALAITSVISWSYISIIITLQLMITVSLSKVVMQISANADKISKEYKNYLKLLKIIEKGDFKATKLKRISNNLLGSKVSCMASFKSITRILNMLDQRNNILVYIALNGLFLYDILLVRSFIKWEKRYMSHIEGWIEEIGELDALISLATYSYNTPQNSWATISTSEDSKIIDAKELYHPFLAYDKAVANSFELDRNNIGIITGANMAGKSTFLRSLGVNYILAANGVSVCAKEFTFSLVSLFSSMRTSDDLSNNISYFNAELLRLKQLILHCSSHPYTLIILDEILKGTNSRDKLKGSIVFLETLVKYPVSGVIATHDLELAKLEDQDTRQYTNYCFEIELAKDIEYSYQITKGVAQNLNATYLLSNMLKDINVVH